MNPSSLKAGGHPSVTYRIDPDATLADQAGDDLKKVVYDFPAGALGNPEAASPKCTATQLDTDKCPSSSYIGSMSTKLRLKVGSFYTTLTSPGSMYILQNATSGSALTVGFIVRPSGYRRFILKTEVTGVVGVRSGTEADYGLTLVVDNLPRTLTTTWGSTVPATLMDFVAILNARTQTDKKGNVFTYMPTRCNVATARATITSYQNVVLTRSDTFEPTGCSTVPFNPTTSYTPSSTQHGATIGMALNVGVPFTMLPKTATDTQVAADQSHGHIRSIQTDLPTGTGLDFPAISAVPELCTEAQLNLDACPAGAKIGSVSTVVPFLPPTMTGDVYMISRGNSVVFGYILRGANGVKAPLKGNVSVVDIDNDGAADNVRAIAGGLPQAPWTSTVINFSTPMIKNPTTCGTQTIKTKMLAWTGVDDSNTAVGKTKDTTNTYTTTGCSSTDTTAPVVSINAPVNNSVTSAASVTLSYAATDNVAVTSCTRVNGSSVALVAGNNAITVSCSDAAGNTGSATVNVFRDNTLPVVTITAPANNSTTTNATTTVTYTATDNQDTSLTCNRANNSTVNLVSGSNTITVSCTDNAGNVGNASVTITRTATDTTAPVVSISAPANNSVTTAASVTLTYTATDNVAVTSCTRANNSSVALVAGNNAIAVSCSDAAGNTGSATVNVFRDNTLPVVTITAPANNSTTTNATTTVTYTATDNQDTSLTCNRANNSTVTLASGVNTITVSCTDNAGNVGSASVTVTLNAADTTAPVVSISAPANNSVTSAASVTLTYTATDNVAVTSCTRANNSTVALVAGNNAITVSCSDAAGNTGSATVNVFRDNTLPVVTITAPANNSSTTNPTATVTYTATDNQDTSLTCNRANNSTVTLASGVNTITVSCTDNAGNVGSASVTVTLNAADTTPPSITISAPANNSVTSAASVTLTYTATDNVAVTSCTRANNSSVALAAGNNAIAVSCSDAAGNTGSATVNVFRDNTLPVVTITSPANGSVTSAATVTVSYTATDNQDTSLSCTPANNSSVALVAGSNTITVSCTDNAGNVGTASTVDYRDNTLPVVTITAPANNSTTTNSTTTVTYTATDNQDTSLSCTPANNSTVNLVAGVNTITVSCTDNAGNVGSASVTVTRNAPDTTAPVVSISAPVNNSVTSAASATLTYTATDNIGVTSCTRANNSTVALVAGNNAITVSCSDAAGNTGSATVNVFRDNTLPVVTITSPANNSSTTAATTTVTYTATDNQDTSLSCTPANNATVNLVSGVNTITVNCTDNAGNVGSSSVTVTRNAADTTAPVVTISAPANNSVTSAASATVTYTATDNVAVTSCTRANNSTVALVAGNNAITVSCSDAAGNTGSATVNVFRDNTLPVVTISAPANNSVTSATSVNVTYTATDNQDTSLTCNRANNTAAALVAGNNAITVSCTDNAGNVGSATVNVFRDNTLPVVTITAPANNSTTTNATTTVTYTATDNQDTSLSCTPANNATVNLVSGVNTITVSCTDNAGNVGTASVTVTRNAPDTTAPVVTISAPANNSVTSAASVTVTYTATDNVAVTSCTRANNSTVALVAGNNAITVSCSDAAGNTGSATVNVFRDNTLPVVTITAPVNNSTTANATTTVTYTATDNQDTSLSCTPANNSTVNLVAGANTITVSCTDNAGNVGSASVIVNRQTATIPNTTISAFGNPSAGAPASGPASPALSVTFTGTNTPTSYECRVDAGAWGTCTSPWTVPTAGLTSPAEHTYEVRGVNAAGSDATPARGFFWYDSRTWTAVPTVTAVANALTNSDTAAEANDAGVHPNITASLSLEGYDDPQSATVVTPDGMMGSLESVTKANRCTNAQATAGTCPASSLIGTGTATATSVTDGAVTANGNIYLVDAPGLVSTDVAGVAVEFENITGSVTGNLGNVIARGGLRVNDHARNIRIVIDSIPRQTTTGNRFHLRSGTLTLNGATRPNTGAVPSATNPALLTNPHICATIGTARPRYNQFYGWGTGYNGSAILETAPVSTTYTVDNCAGVPFSPTVNYTVDNRNAGQAGPIHVDMNLPYDNGTTRSLTSTLPPWLSANTQAFGASTDMCNPAIAKNASPTGTTPGYLYFDFDDPTMPCPALAKVGTVEVNTPLISSAATGGVVKGDVWLIDKSPVPWLGIRVSPNVDANNPQGLKIGIIITTTVVSQPAGCIVGVDDPCYDYLRATASAMPDAPMTRVNMHLGTISGRNGQGSVTSDFPIKNAQASDSSCLNAGFNATTALVPWSAAGTVTLNQLLQPIGCNQ